jgi:hypothetical protein
MIEMKYAIIEAFFELLRAGLWENDARLSQFGEIDYKEVMRLAEEQSVVGLIAAGIEHVIEEKVPQNVSLPLIGRTLQLEQQNQAMNRIIARLVDNMRKKNIYSLLLKGQGIAQYYERPLWRACGDIDFLLSNENYEKAKDYLLPLASSAENEYAYNHHLGMTIEGWVVELHGSLRSGLSSRVDKVTDEIKKDVFYGGNVRSWMNGKSQVFLLGIDCDVIFVFTHFLKHFYKEGLGLRQVCDWCRLLWTYKDSLNHRLLESRIKKAGLMTEWKAFSAFAVEYLGMPSEAMPFYSADEKWKRKADKICAFILEVGNMGHNRDMSHFEKYPYLVRKTCSMGRRCGDLIRHARIFPLDSLRFFPRIMFNGLRSAARGE